MLTYGLPLTIKQQGRLMLILCCLIYTTHDEANGNVEIDGRLLRSMLSWAHLQALEYYTTIIWQSHIEFKFWLAFNCLGMLTDQS